LIRDADWFGPDRARDYSRAIALFYLPFLVYYYCVIAFGPRGCDFAAFWAAGRLAWHNAALAYDHGAMKALQSWIAPQWWMPFNNPPPFLLAVAPFGALPVQVAQPLWVVATLGIYLLACRRIVGMWPALAFTPVFWTCAVGQNGLLTGALFIGGISQLERRPFVAGLLLGAVVIKPQLAILTPIALLAGGHWRAIAGAAVSSLGLLGLSAIVFGPHVFAGFLSGTAVSTAIMTNGALALKQCSPFEAALALSGSFSAAAAVQATVTLTGAGVVAWAWRRDGGPLWKGAILATGAALATPYLFGYDLVFLILPVAWLAREGARDGFLPWDRLVIGLVFVVPLIGEPLARLGLHFNPCFLAQVALLAALIRRTISQPVSIEVRLSPWPSPHAGISDQGPHR
jgi:hypothetical protein